MVYVFGMNLPVVELMFIVVILFIVGLGFMIWQILQIDRHLKILEQTTFEIKKFEEEEKQEVQRLDADLDKFESSEAELFVAKVTPTVAKLENFVMAQLFSGKKEDKVVDLLVAKNIKKEHAVKIVNQVVYYLDYYHKMPKGQQNVHHNNVDKMKVTGVVASATNQGTTPKKAAVKKTAPRKMAPVKNTPGRR